MSRRDVRGLLDLRGSLGMRRLLVLLNLIVRLLSFLSLRDRLGS